MRNLPVFSKCRIAAAIVTLSPLLLSTPLHAAAGATNTVVYVAGDNLIVNRSTDGMTYSYKVQPTSTLTTDGGSVPVSGLKPGSVITGPIAGTGKAVDDASVVSGKVISVSPPNTLLVGISGENKQVIIPSGSVKEDGKDVPVASVKAGDEVQLTMVLVRAEGDNRPLSSVKPPAMQGALALFMEPNLEMPDSGTRLPLYGTVGAVLLALGFGLKSRRRVTN